MKLTVCVLAVLVGAGIAQSGPRLNVLSGDARLMLDDYSEIWAYPGTMAKYQFGIVTSESASEMDAGQYGLGWFGCVMDFDGVTWGATHNHNGQLLEVLFHSGNYGIIVGLDYASTPADSEMSGEKDLAFNVAFGTEIDLFGDYTDLAVGAGYDSMEDTGIDTTYGKTTDLMVGASLRGHTDGLFNLFPIISVGFEQSKDEEGDADFTTTNIVAEFGAGINKMYAPNTQFVVGAFMGVTNTSYSVSEGEAQDSEMYIELLGLRGGVEQQLLRWLVLRAGAESETYYDKIGDADAAIGTYVDGRFGLGFEVGNFTLNADISQEFMHNGPYLVGGQSNGFLGNIACIYDF